MCHWQCSVNIYGQPQVLWEGKDLGCSLTCLRVARESDAGVSEAPAAVASPNGLVPSAPGLGVCQPDSEKD